MEAKGLMAPHGYSLPGITDGQKDQLEDLLRAALKRAKLSKSGAQRIITQGDVLLNFTEEALQKLAFPPYATSAPFYLTFERSIFRRDLVRKLETTSWGIYSGWTIWQDSEEKLKRFIASQVPHGSTGGMYCFVRFPEPFSYEKALSVLKEDGVQLADFYEFLQAMIAYDQGKIELPMESSGGNTRGNFFSMAEGYMEVVEDATLWLPGAQISYHDVDSWKLLLVKSWKELMGPWFGFWHVLVRLPGAVE